MTVLAYDTDTSMQQTHIRTYMCLCVCLNSNRRMKYLKLNVYYENCINLRLTKNLRVEVSFNISPLDTKKFQHIF